MENDTSSNSVNSNTNRIEADEEDEEFQTQHEEQQYQIREENDSIDRQHESHQDSTLMTTGIPQHELNGDYDGISTIDDNDGELDQLKEQITRDLFQQLYDKLLNEIRFQIVKDVLQQQDDLRNLLFQPTDTFFTPPAQTDQSGANSSAATASPVAPSSSSPTQLGAETSTAHPTSHGM